MLDRPYDPRSNPQDHVDAITKVAISHVEGAVGEIAREAGKSPYEVAQTVAAVLSALPRQGEGGQYQVGDLGLRSDDFEEAFSGLDPTLSIQDISFALKQVTDRTAARDSFGGQEWQ
jgi:hypothetical protein